MADNETKGFSAPEMRFITAFFTNIKTKPEVDWDQVAVDASLKDSRCARDRFRQIMAKHGCQAASSGASPRKGKKGPAEEPQGSSPTKVTKRAPRKKAVKKKDSDEEEGSCGEKVKDEDSGDC